MNRCTQVVQASAPNSDTRIAADQLFSLLSTQPDIHSDMVTKGLIAPSSKILHIGALGEGKDESARILERMDFLLTEFTDAVYDELKDAEERQAKEEKKTHTKKAEKDSSEESDEEEGKEEEEIKIMIKDDEKLVSNLQKAHGKRTLNPEKKKRESKRK